MECVENGWISVGGATGSPLQLARLCHRGILPAERATAVARMEGGSVIGKHRLIVLLAVVALVTGMVCAAVGFVGGLILGQRLDGAWVGGDGPTVRVGETAAGEGLVWFKIHAEDGALYRSAEPVRAEVPYSNVGWVILTVEGETVLHRNAENEYRYDHGCWAGSGLVAHIIVWYEGAYHRASETVPLECE